jgi:ubiquinone/menaquinone biosynthesis C-methylase UbiE
MLFFEIFNGELPRQGPGDDKSALKALALVPSRGAEGRVLDLGCGTGPQTLVLARHSAGRITAIDSHAPFVEVLNRRARELGCADRVEARVGDMRQLDFAPGSFDLIWCEGAIYILGFEAGLRDWRRLLAPGGHIAVTEVCWTRPDPPPECAAFWAKEYPAIRDVPALLRAIAECGYETIDHFTLPASSWWEGFYRPLQGSVTTFRERHSREPDAQELADQVQREIDMWHAYSAFYSYEFFVMRAP